MKKLVAIVVVLLLGLALFWQPLLKLPGQLITRDDGGPEKADVVILLLGSSYSRSKHAASLYHEGKADRILFGRVEKTEMERLGFSLNDAETSRKVLAHFDVPESVVDYREDIVVTSTRDEAKAYLDLLAQETPRPKSVLVVTDWYHTSRAHWIFEQVNEGRFAIETSAATLPTSHPDAWYKHEGAFLATFSEYLKWTYYMIHY